MVILQKNSEKQIGQFVAEDYRTAAVFSKYKIDFCCNGNRTINEACEKKGLDSNVLLDELDSVLNAKGEQSIDYKSWPLDLLIDYIENILKYNNIKVYNKWIQNVKEHNYMTESYNLYRLELSLYLAK